jgi:hypothetical protein
MFWQNMYLVFMDLSQHKSTPDQTVLTITVNKLNSTINKIHLFDYARKDLQK